MKSRLASIDKESTADIMMSLAKRGVFPLVVLHVEDVINHAEQAGLKITPEAAHKAAHWMWAEYDLGPEYEAAMDYALDKAVEYSPELNNE